MKIWLLHPQRFYKGVVQTLSDRGIQITYLCGEPDRLRTLPIPTDCMIHSLWDAIRGEFPGAPCEIATPDPAIVRELSSSESTVLQMFERLNATGLGIQDLRRVYFKYVGLWSSLLARECPDAVVFHITPHMGYDYTLYLICQARGIRTLIFERTYLPDRLVLIEAIEKMPKPGPEVLEQYVGSTKDKEEPTGKSYYDSWNRSLEGHRSRKMTKLDLMRDSLWRGTLFALQVGRRPLEMRRRNASSVYAIAPRMPTRFAYLWRELVDSIHLFRLREFYESHTELPQFETNYIYYPLQFQPERTSVPMGLSFGDQLLGLGMLIDCLPEGWQVYVKEHPRQFTDNAIRGRLGRTLAFYDRLLDMDGSKVRLLSISASSETLIRNSRCVATVSGTAGWEAVRSGIPAIVFGAPWYLHSPGVFHVGSRDECIASIGRIRTGTSVDSEKVGAFIRWMYDKGSFPGYIGDLFGRDSSLTEEENASSYADVLISRLSQLDLEKPQPVRSV